MAVQHLKKLISLFYKNYSDKPTIISKVINIVLPIDRPTIKPMALKQKQGQPIKSTVKQTPLKQKKGQSINSTNKQAKKN